MWIPYGGTTNFAISSNAHYHVTNVVVDGASIGPTNGYTFASVTNGGQTVTALFGIDRYSLTVGSLYGAPAPSGTTTSDWNALVVAAVASPVTNGSTTQYVCTGWTGTGSVTNGAGTNTSFDLTADSTLTWTWKTQYLVTAGAGANGAVSAPAAVWVDAGGSTPSYTATPDGGYRVNQWYVNGSSVQAGGTTFSAAGVAGPSTIQVTFVVGPQVSITWPTNGTVFASPAAVTVLVSAVTGDAGGITNVRVHAGTKLIGDLTNGPYCILWVAPLVSNYVLTATAYDASANAATSAPVHIFALSTLWDGATDLPGNWRYLPWFGWFNDAWGTWGGWIYHAEHGWMYPFGSSTSSIWFWNPRMGAWLWIREGNYPSLWYWSDSWQSWLWYYEGTGHGSGGWFYDYGIGRNEWL